MKEPIAGLSDINGELCDFSNRWAHDGDYLRCRKCNRPQITSYMDMAFPHAARCKAAPTAEPHPWRTYLDIVGRLATAVRAAQQGADSMTGSTTSTPEREAFEAWARSERLPIDRVGDEYRWDDVRKRWEGWQARATQAAAMPAGKSLNAQAADLLRPFLKPGDKVIWRQPFRWFDDDGVLPNHYDSMELEALAADFGYDIDWDTNFKHAAIIRAAAAGDAKPTTQETDQ